MSAFIVNKSHINAMLQGAMAISQRYNTTHRWHHNGEWHELTPENADEIGQMLLDENIKSVSYRYQDSSVTELPGQTDSEYLVPFQFHPMGKVPKPIELIKITRCYEYQACEHEEWETSEAKAFCDSVIDNAIGNLPGYDEALWEWEEILPSNKVVRLINSTRSVFRD